MVELYAPTLCFALTMNRELPLRITLRSHLFSQYALHKVKCCATLHNYCASLKSTHKFPQAVSPSPIALDCREYHSHQKAHTSDRLSLSDTSDLSCGAPLTDPTQEGASVGPQFAKSCTLHRCIKWNAYACILLSGLKHPIDYNSSSRISFDTL